MSRRETMRWIMLLAIAAAVIGVPSPFLMTNPQPWNWFLAGVTLGITAFNLYYWFDEWR